MCSRAVLFRFRCKSALSILTHRRGRRKHWWLRQVHTKYAIRIEYYYMAGGYSYRRGGHLMFLLCNNCKIEHAHILTSSHTNTARTLLPAHSISSDPDHLTTKTPGVSEECVYIVSIYSATTGVTYVTSVVRTSATTARRNSVRMSSTIRRWQHHAFLYHRYFSRIRRHQHKLRRGCYFLPTCKW